MDCLFASFRLVFAVDFAILDFAVWIFAKDLHWIELGDNIVLKVCCSHRIGFFYSLPPLRIVFGIFFTSHDYADDRESEEVTEEERIPELKREKRSRKTAVTKTRNNLQRLHASGEDSESIENIMTSTHCGSHWKHASSLLWMNCKDCTYAWETMRTRRRSWKQQRVWKRK